MNDQPSDRYRDLLDQYRALHAESESIFPGKSLPRHAADIAVISRETGARTILDYGSGKGRQYQPMKISAPDGRIYQGIPEFWGAEVTCFDPAWPPFSERPSGTFDGVVCTDVLEHCPSEDLGWIIGDLFGYARKFVYSCIACFPAQKLLPNGENAHCSVFPPEFWQDRLAEAGRASPEVLLVAVLAAPHESGRTELLRLVGRGGRLKRTAIGFETP